MHQQSPPQNTRISYLESTLWKYKLCWIVPAIVGFVLASTYALLLRPETWTARQSFIVRDDLLGEAFKPGRFESQESLKSAQETILEVARRPLVVRSVLEKLGPSSSWASENWITDEVIEETQGEINFSAPNGAEFGNTEVIVLTAKASSRERTRQFIELLSEEIITQVNHVRSLRLASMESELQQTYNGAVASQEEAMKRLAELDERLGPDVGVMNSLSDGQSADSSLKREIAEIKAEVRTKQSDLEKAEAVLVSLLRAFDNPEQTDLSSSVLEEQKNLEKLRDDLTALKLELAVAKGRFQDRHVDVRTLQNAIEIQKKYIHDELTSEMEGVQANIAMLKNQIENKTDQIASLDSRLMMLSKHRTEYLALNTQVKELTEAALRAKTSWGMTKSLAGSARTVGLITPMDVAQVSSRPDGVGKKIVAVAGLIAGLFIGLGLMLLIAPGMDPEQPNDLGGSPAPLPPRDPLPEPNRTNPNAGPIIAPAPGSAFSSPASVSSSASGAMQMSAPAPQSTSVPTASVANQQSVASEAEASATTFSKSDVAAERPTSASVAQAQPDQPPKLREPVDSKGFVVNPVASAQLGARQRSTAPTESVTVNQEPTTAKPVAANPIIPQTKKSNVRPVDLVKSAEKENAFVRVNPDAAANDAAEAKSTPSESSQPSAKSAASKPRRENPFLRSISKTEIASDVDGDQDAKTTEPSVPPTSPTGASETGGAVKTATQISTESDSADPVSPRPIEDTRRAVPLTIPIPATFSSARETEPTMEMEKLPGGENNNLQDAIPEQIRKLSQSIMRFNNDQPAE
jgi:hypothetical protein